LPGKICKFHLQIFLTGKYPASEKIIDKARKRLTV
jgi:hypothetical protein